jgi:prepilin-type N-terminal cleavage/methylation domain-containing protein
MKAARVPNRRAGFTLAELLVSIAIIGVVSGLGLRAYTLAIDYYGEARSEGETDQAIQTALRSIEEDITSTLPSSITGVGIAGTKQPYDGGEDAALVVPTSVPTMATGRAAAAWVKYEIRRDTDGTRLVRTAVPLHQPFPPNGGAEVLAGVHGFRVDYLNEAGTWLDQWSGNASPVAVRITVTASEPGSIAAPNVSRSVVYRVPSP